MDNQKTIKHDDHFWQMNRDLVDVGATYVSLLIFNANKDVLYSKSSNPDWMEEFTSTGLYKKCHLLRAAHDQMAQSQQHLFTLAWDLYSPPTEEAYELEEIRKYKNITHGVGFCIKDHETRLMLNIAGKYSDINFGLNILKNRKEVYRSLRYFTLPKNV